MICVKCDGTGWATAYKVEKPLQEFSFLCDCGSAEARGMKATVGQGYNSNAPKWVVSRWSPERALKGGMKLREFTGESEAEYRDHCAKYFATVKR